MPLPWLAVIAADIILLHNASILTLDSKNTVAQSLAYDTATGRITAINRVPSSVTRRIDLNGATVIPGFYAAHDHFPNPGIQALTQVDLNSPPIGRIRNISELVAALQAKARATPEGQWILGRGYDDTLLAEKRHPTRLDLDNVSTRHPVWIVHTSGHLGVANTVALQLANVTRDTPQPEGGRIRLDAQGNPNGVFEEKLTLVSRLAPQPTPEQRIQAVRDSQQLYFNKGVTTTVIAGIQGARIADLQHAELQTVPLRSDTASATAGGVKLWHDGSLQGYTGYLTAPYHTGDPDHRGYPTRTRAQLIDVVTRLHRKGLQIAIHGNGDAAIDDILDAFEHAQKQLPRPDARHRIEHCQTAREDQLVRMKKLGVTPSFFVAHVYYWGDRHRDLFLGPRRAARISPLASALRHGVRFTLHNDSPVTPVNPLHLIWCAVNRKTKDGVTLGPDQRIAPLAALRAVTSDAAWQNFQEDSKGTLEPGKQADLVVLDQNPLAIAPERIADIRVLETILNGKNVYQPSHNQ